ncbi:energy transducer TonB [Chryseobacterium chendengshani]|uniref:energy transducer TonB n=1 Tax=unclassified Chryseobacterium TaxID=2593645 RepID=UPI001C641508|nr:MULTISPECIES: hypothetical protein [unclassified Chryseobacterium]MBW7675388.1 hypothetical protein [Chryseobacterium sp. LJ756]MBW8522040.1 hypothetical protein [Chryseobacterium sp. LJ668]QYK17692.1 hypothetical protein K0U91_06090 [Chryseobacterium sp. LJ668]
MKKTVFFLLFFTTLFSAQTSGSKTVVQKNGPAIPDYAILQTKMSLKDVVTNADTAPEFPGGLKVFKRKYFESIETLDVKIKEKVDTRLYFIIEKSGYVRNVTAIGSNKKHTEAAELGLRRIFARWKPATIKGEPVRYLMYFPLTSKEF